MEQEAEGRGSKQQPHQPQPPQPQQCPRCESLNTKFCYYNNYSLSQPRFFCKACKRYWTQGGTLRNIPIGGGSRKGKRSKGSSSSSTMSSSELQPQSKPQPQLQPQPQSQSQPATQDVVQNLPNMTVLMRPTPPRVVQSSSPYYQGGGVCGSGVGGYLSSLAAVHSLNPPPQPLNQSLDIGVGDVVASPNTVDLLPGFNTPASASLGSQNHHPSQIRPSQFYQIGNNRVVGSLLCSEQGFNVTPSMANSCAASRPDHGPQSFTNNANHRGPDASLWSTMSTTTSISGNTQNNTRGGSSSSLIPNHWPNLPGNGSPYQ